ncbi:MAG TPA: DUF6499 domain-containing protein [Acetobacteraceae bacterium]|nr:DUF6499 domain-containing protein [Acetobacteraceae bacterium]
MDVLSGNNRGFHCHSTTSVFICTSHGRPVIPPIGHNSPPDWRDATSYERLCGIDRAGLMWEWLRRDRDYVAWYVQASKATCGVDPQPLRWGLHFRRASGPRGPGRPDHLACRFRSRDDCCHRSADRSRQSRLRAHRPARAVAGDRGRCAGA